MHGAFTEAADAAIAVHLISTADWPGSQARLPKQVAAFAKALAFTGAAGQSVNIPGEDGQLETVLYGVGDGTDALIVAGLSQKLPAGIYRIDRIPENMPFSWIAAGWADGAYRFERYLSGSGSLPRLEIPTAEDAAAISLEATAIDEVRTLVNTPACDMGPDQIEQAVRDLAGEYGADVSSIVGDGLLEANYPMVHAVGRAGAVAPRIVELSWGKSSDPELAIVGKGVSFDSGGLNIKTGNFMRIMKKDMGGAAHAIGLARLVMGAALPVRLKLYIPTVENAISGNAFRPGDVLQSRAGITVEIDNTDAEGRLILGDALARASEGSPDLIVDFATLTGAARVALGPDLAPFYTDDDDLAASIVTGADASGDPAWRMPLWSSYMGMLKSSIADCANSGGRMAGSITAALFLKQFVSAKAWVHLDVWAWREAKYGRPAGGAACGLRAVWTALQNRYG
ncbi:MAG: leucyl aminopeptidase family protein [Pseudomonadota bacterium]